jgi:hypothetical protein
MSLHSALPAAGWSDWAPANQSGIRWEGRVRFKKDGSAVYDWAQVRLHARFTGPKLAVYVATAANYLDVAVDGKVIAVLGRQPEVDQAPLLKFWVGAHDPEGRAYVLENLGRGEHNLVITKRTGPNIGAVRLWGLRVGEGEQLLAPPQASPRRIEFLGDSLSVGYGNEGPGDDCQQLAPYENSSLAWAALLAKSVGAESQVLAYSGYGVIRNYGSTDPASEDPFPFYYPRTVLADEGHWKRENFDPQVAISFLGSNDYSTKPHPIAADFIKAYRAFLANVRKGRPGLPILCVYPQELPVVARQVIEVVSEEQGDGLPTEGIGFPGARQAEMGCDGHPQVSVHRHWAALAEPKLRSMMKWTD